MVINCVSIYRFEGTFIKTSGPESLRASRVTTSRQSSDTASSLLSSTVSQPGQNHLTSSAPINSENENADRFLEYVEEAKSLKSVSATMQLKFFGIEVRFETHCAYIVANFVLTLTSFEYLNVL